MMEGILPRERGSGVAITWTLSRFPEDVLHESVIQAKSEINIAVWSPRAFEFLGSHVGIALVH